MMALPPKDIGSAVPEGRARGIEPGSRLPGRHGRSMAEVWGLTDEQVKRVYERLHRKDRPLKRPKKVVPDEPRKIGYAGHDPEETQFKWTRG